MSFSPELPATSIECSCAHAGVLERLGGYRCARGRDHFGIAIDTVHRLSSVQFLQMARAGNVRHTLSAVLIEREETSREKGEIHTFLSVHILPAIPFSFSSTAARKALCKGPNRAALVSSRAE